MINDSDILNVTGLIYDASLDAGLWQVALVRIADLLGGEGTSLTVHDETGLRNEAACAIRMDESYFGVYRDYYHTLNFYMPPSVKNAQAGAVITSGSLMPDAGVYRSEFYNDYLRPQNMFGALGTIVAREPGLLSLLTTFRPPGAQPFGEEEVRLLGAITPHLARAIRIGRRLDDISAGASTMDLLPVGIAMLGSKGEVVFCNRSAGAVLNAGDGLCLSRSGVVEATNQPAARRLREMIRLLLSHAPESENVEHDNMLVERPSGRRSYTVAGCRLASGRMNAWPGVKAALFINDPEANAEAGPDRLSRLFGLTPREAKIAQVLSRGGSIDDACEELGVVRPTVRTHLQNLFQKLDVSRQSELVSMLHRSLAGLPRP